MIQVSIIIPTFNEVENIQVLLNKLTDILVNSNTSYEIIVVDDNSPDGTSEVVKEIQELNSNIKLIKRFHEKGLSSAVLSGMSISMGQSFLVMDADLQHDENIIPKMIEKLKEYDIVIGSRLSEKGSYGKWKGIRKILSYVSANFSRLLFGLKVKEPLSGFFAIRRIVYEEISPKINPRGFKILLEFLGRKKKFTVVEVGYTFRERRFGKTKLSRSVILDFLFSILEIRFGIIFSSLFLKYSFIGLTGVIVNLLGQWVAINLLGLQKHNHIQGYSLPGLAVGFGFLISVMNNYYWNNRWTFALKEYIGKSENVFGFFKFSIVSIFGFIIQISVWRYLLETLIQYNPSTSENYLSLFSNFVGILFATSWNYYLNKSFTWKLN